MRQARRNSRENGREACDINDDEAGIRCAVGKLRAPWDGIAAGSSRRPGPGLWDAEESAQVVCDRIVRKRCSGEAAVLADREARRPVVMTRGRNNQVSRSDHNAKGREEVKKQASHLNRQRVKEMFLSRTLEGHRTTKE